MDRLPSCIHPVCLLLELTATVYSHYIVYVFGFAGNTTSQISQTDLQCTLSVFSIANIPSSLPVTTESAQISTAIISVQHETTHLPLFYVYLANLARKCKSDDLVVYIPTGLGQSAKFCSHQAVAREYPCDCS